VQIPDQVPLSRGQSIGITLPLAAVHVFREDGGAGIGLERGIAGR
jgi:hypothetical protein